MFKLNRIAITAENANRLLKDEKIRPDEYKDFVLNYVYKRVIPQNIRQMLKTDILFKNGQSLDIDVSQINDSDIVEVAKSIVKFADAVTNTASYVEEYKKKVVEHQNKSIFGDSDLDAMNCVELAEIVKKNFDESQVTLSSIGGIVIKGILPIKITTNYIVIRNTLDKIGLDMYHMINIGHARIN